MLNKMSKSKKKQTPLPTRPPPPTVDMILKDMEMAPVDDVAFTCLRNKEKGDSPTDAEAEEILAAYDKQTPSAPHSDDGFQEEENLSATVDTVYKKVNQFLENCDFLKRAPDILNEQCTHLESVAKDLEKTVSALENEALFRQNGDASS